MTGILKGKQTKKLTLEGLNCPTVDKVLQYVDRKNNSQAMVQKSQDSISALEKEVAELQERFAETGDESLIETIATKEGKLATSRNMKRLQQEAIKKGLKHLVVTDEDREQLKETFDQVRKEEFDLTHKLHMMLVEFEKLLNELNEERDNTQPLHAQLNGMAMIATDMMFPFYNETRQNALLVEALHKLHELTTHKAFPKNFFD